MAAILEAAARIFDRGAATTSSIARVAGVSIGSLYEYFPNKDAILEALAQRHIDEALGSLERELAALDAATLPLEDAVRRLVDLILELHADRPGLHRWFATRLLASATFQRQVVDAERRIGTQLEALLRTHAEVVVDDPALAARIVVEGTDAVVHRHIEDDRGVSGEAFAAELTRLWVGYLRGEGRPGVPR